jgi:hypothetical protein
MVCSSHMRNVSTKISLPSFTETPAEAVERIVSGPTVAEGAKRTRRAHLHQSDIGRSADGKRPVCPLEGLSWLKFWRKTAEYRTKFTRARPSK